jgi:hypothetical protein
MQAAQVTGRGGSHGLLTAQEHVKAAQVTGRGGRHGLLTAQEHVQAAQVTGRGGRHGLLTAQEHVQAEKFLLESFNKAHPHSQDNNGAAFVPKAKTCFGKA